MYPNFNHVVSEHTVCTFSSITQYQSLLISSIMKFSFSVAQPRIITPLDNTTIVIHEGMNRSFTCEATGYPIPTVTWHRVNGSSIAAVVMYDHILTGDGSANVLTGGGSVSVNLVITNASREIIGVYMCSASNIVGTDSRSITIVCKCILIMRTTESLLSTYVCALSVPPPWLCDPSNPWNKVY